MSTDVHGARGKRASDQELGREVRQVGRIQAVVSCLFFLSSLAFNSSAFAIGEGNVLVLYNSASAEGQQIANYYKQVHPGVTLLGLNNVPVTDQITATQYLTDIAPQVRSALNSNVDVIVTTKGLPHRIVNTSGPTPFPSSYTYTDPSGVVRTIWSSSYKIYSSLESELTRVSTIQTWEQMGDQGWWQPNSSNPSKNPYFKANGTFSNTNAGNDQLRLTSRLDGFSVSDVVGSIDRAQKVFIVPFGQQVVIDNSPAAVATGMTSMASLANNVLAPLGQSYVYDNLANPVLTASKPVIGYVSHGMNDGYHGPGSLEATYMRTQLDFQLAKGAIVHTWESFNGISFTEGGNAGQGLIGDWIAAGGTAGIAHVQEPGANLNNVTNEDRMFQMMLGGYTWAESAWNATRQVSYVNTVVGDPLMVWRPWLAGDANLDGIVNPLDYSAMRLHWLSQGSFAEGDFNGDGWVNPLDYAILRLNWQRVAAGLASLSITPGEEGEWLLPPMPAIPEPASGTLLFLGCLGLIGRRNRRSI